MLEKTHWQRLGVAIFSALAVSLISLAYGCVHPNSLLDELRYEEPPLNLSACNNPCIVVEHGVKALRGRTPGVLIRGMVDSDHPEYALVDFERAALLLAPTGNPSAEFILGWLCANGNTYTRYMGAIEEIPKIDFSKLGLTQDRQLAARWYQMASMHGSSAASVALGNMLDYSYGGDHEKSLALAANFYKRGIEQGDIEARTHLACSYAYGRGVQEDGARAWKELEEVIKNSDEDNSIYAIILAIQAWKDGKIVPPKTFSRGAANAYEFASRYASTMPGAQLDDIYTDPGCTPNPYPQYRRELATAIRKDWLKKDRLLCK